MTLAQKLTYGFLLAGLVAAGGEVGIRIYDYLSDGVPLTASPAIADLITRDSTGAHGTPNGRFRDIQLNSAGFRSPEAALASTPGCIRVMTIGASETLGTGSGAQGNEYPAQLQDSLAGHGCFRVLNAGIQGMGLRSQVSFWTTWARGFHPDIVVVLVNPSLYLLDTVPPFPRNVRRTRPRTSAPRRISSRLVDHIQDQNPYPDFILRQRVNNNLARIVAGKRPDWFFTEVPKDRVALFRHDLDSLLTIIQAEGSTPVLAAYPVKFVPNVSTTDSTGLLQWREYAPRATPAVLVGMISAARVATLELGRERGVITVDPPTALNGRPEFFSEYGHYTAAGARVVAGEVKRGVIEAATRRSLQQTAVH